MQSLGVTAYPDLSSMEDIKQYFHLASRYGFTRVVSSMLSVEGTNKEIIIPCWNRQEFESCERLRQTERLYSRLFRNILDRDGPGNAPLP